MFINKTLSISQQQQDPPVCPLCLFQLVSKCVLGYVDQGMIIEMAQLVLSNLCAIVSFYQAKWTE